MKIGIAGWVDCKDDDDDDTSWTLASLIRKGLAGAENVLMDADSGEMKGYCDDVNAGVADPDDNDNEGEGGNDDACCCNA